MVISVANNRVQQSTINSNAVGSIFARDDKKDRLERGTSKGRGASPDGYQPQVRVNNTMRAMLLEQMH